MGIDRNDRASTRIAMTDSLCIIPARGGSKRIPRKNVRPFLGEPIIARTIRIALEANCFAEVMVSTDDDEIAEVARASGASVPFRRSTETSGDHADTLSVLNEVIGRYRENGRNFELCCCLYATAVLTQARDLREGRDVLVKNRDLVYVVPVVNFSYPIQRAVVIEDGRLRMLHSEHYSSRSQDLPKTYHDAGQWYWFRTNQIKEKVPILGASSGAVPIPELNVHDIDTEEDWRLAELKFRLRGES